MQQQTEPTAQRIMPISLMGIYIVTDKAASAPPMLIKYPCGDCLSSESIFNPLIALENPKAKPINARACNIKYNATIS